MSETVFDLFSDLNLARRLEGAEARANAGFVDARRQCSPEVGAAWIDVAGTYAMYDGPASPLTQTFGLGMHAPVDAAVIAELEGFFQARGAPVFHEICPLAGPELGALLARRRYVPVEHSSVMYQAITGERLQDASEGLEPRAVHDEAGYELWRRTAAEGWSESPGIGPFVEEMGRLTPHARDWHGFIVEAAGLAVAAGSLVLSEGVALLAGASTIPGARRRGAQRALLVTRLRFAAAHGADVAMVVALPGSASQRNAERQGFRVAYTRTKWQLAP